MSWALGTMRQNKRYAPLATFLLGDISDAIETHRFFNLAKRIKSCSNILVITGCSNSSADGQLRYLLSSTSYSEYSISY